MKKILVLIVAALMALGLAVPVSADQVKDLITDGRATRADVGDLDISVVGDQLVITFTTTGGWEFVETHLYVGQVPPAKSSPGQFPLKHESLAPATSDFYSIPLPAPGTLYVAAQAAVRLFTVTGYDITDPLNPVPIYGYVYESAWAQSPDLSGDIHFGKGKNWATYFVYTLQ